MISSHMHAAVTLAVVVLAGAEAPGAARVDPSNASLAVAANASAGAPRAAKLSPPLDASPLVAARSGSCTQSQCADSVSTGTSICTAATSVLGIIPVLTPITTAVETGCTWFKNPVVVSTACKTICGPDAPPDMPDYSEVMDAMDRQTMKQQAWFERLSGQVQQVLVNVQEMRAEQRRIQAQVAENARLIQESYRALSGQLSEIQRQLHVMSYFEHYNSEAMLPVENCLGIFLSYVDNPDGPLAAIYKQDLVNCAWGLGNERFGPVKELAAMLTTGNSQAATYAGSIWDIGSSEDNRAFCEETPRRHYMEYLPTAAFLRSAALVFIQEGMRPAVRVGLRGAAAGAPARSGSLDTQEGVKAWLDETMQRVDSEFSSRCPPGEWQVQLHFPPAWWNVRWDLKTLAAFGKGGEAMTISAVAADGWSPSPDGHEPAKALDGSDKTSFRLPAVSDGYRVMDDTWFSIGGVIETVDGREEDWTVERCMKWCNEEPDCAGFEFPYGAVAPGGEIRQLIKFQTKEAASTVPFEGERTYLKLHAYGGGSKIAQFVVKETWRNGASESPELIVASAQSPQQPRDSPVLMVVRYRGRDGKTLVPTPLVAHAPLGTSMTKFYTACYTADAPWPKAGCEQQQCFVRDWSSRGNTIAGADSVVSDAGECQVACQKHPGCVYWTFYGNAKDEVKNSCALKTQAADVFTLQVGAVSGPARCATPP